MQLGSTLSFDANTQNIELPKNDVKYGAVTNALRELELSKIFLFVSNARQILTNNPKSKVIIAFNYVDSIKRCQQELLDYNPLVIHGSTKEDARTQAIEAFQRHDWERRVLIMSTKVGGVAISLQDIHGDSERYILGSPNHSIIDSHQLSGRIARIGSKSLSHIYFIFVMVDNYSELPILQAMITKFRVLSETVKRQVEAGIKLPGSYNVLVEDAEQAAVVQEMINKLKGFKKYYGHDVDDEILDKEFEEKLSLEEKLGNHE